MITTGRAGGGTVYKNLDPLRCTVFKIYIAAVPNLTGVDTGAVNCVNKYNHSNSC